MVVRELILHLQGCDPEAPVHLAYPSGDHWRTTLAPAVALVDEGRVVHSDYHRADKLVDADEPADEGGTARAVVIIS